MKVTTIMQNIPILSLFDDGSYGVLSMSNEVNTNQQIKIIDNII